MEKPDLEIQKSEVQSTIKDIKITVSLAPLVRALGWRIKIFGWVMIVLQKITGFQINIMSVRSPISRSTQSEGDQIVSDP